MHGVEVDRVSHLIHGPTDNCRLLGSDVAGWRTRSLRTQAERFRTLTQFKLFHDDVQAEVPIALFAATLTHEPRNRIIQEKGKRCFSALQQLYCFIVATTGRMGASATKKTKGIASRVSGRRTDRLNQEKGAE